MSKIRVYELAKKLGIPPNLLVEELRALGIDVSSGFSTLDESAMVKLGGKMAAPKLTSAPAKKPAAPAEPAPKPAAPKAPAPAPAPVKATLPFKPATPAKVEAAVEPPKPAAPKHTPPPARRILVAKTPAQRAAQAAAKAAEPPVEAPVAPPPAEKEKKVAAAKTPAEKTPAKSKTAAEKAPAKPKAETEKTSAKPKTASKTTKTATAEAHEAPATEPSAAAPAAGPGHEKPAAAPKAAPAAKAPQAPAPAAAHTPARPERPDHPIVHHGPGVARPTGVQHVAAPRAPQPAYPQRQGQPQASRPQGSMGQRPGGAPGQHRPGGPSAPQRDQRPSHPPARPSEPRPAPAAPPRAPEPARAPSRLAPAPGQHRKSKRDRRLDKLQAKQDRRERLESELEQARANAETGEAVFIREGITVKELADKLNQKVRDVIAKLMSRGILATINQPLDRQVAIELCSQFGFAAEVISFEDELVLEQEETSEEKKSPRAPVVTVMGHVDHGKSSLLEAIHDVDITSKEFGGITQHIGAYKVRHGEREYVFLDTPGHEAFTLMRARGAQVTDIVILVVAADDGVMPQTIEAINHCKAAKVPMVVAINKMDKPGADIDRVKRNLSEQGILTEDWGGEVVSVPVSAKTRKGVEELLEMVALVADMLNLKANPDALASGTVLESRMDRARGPVATVLVQDGHIKVGDLFLCGTTYGHVRNLFDDKGVRIESAGPSSPVEVLGFPEVPGVGALFQGMDDEAKARQVASFRKEQEKAKALRTVKVRLDNVFGAIQQGEIQELPIILKADVHGSLEAIAQKLQELATDEIKIRVVHQGVGAVSEGDILLASASNAVVIGFNVRPERKAQELAKAEGVDISLFTVIYDLIDRMKQALTGMLKPIEEEVVLGHAEVRQIFKVSKVGTVAGCIVSDGKIVKAAKVRVLRDNVVVHSGKMAALKRFKDDASEVKDGTECGISIENFNDVKPGDVLESFEIRFQERTL
jgi:translation initiation factor IF-2